MHRREFIAGAAALLAAACTDSDPAAGTETDATVPTTTSAPSPTSSTSASPATAATTTTIGSDLPTVQPVPTPDPGISLRSPGFALGVASGDPDASGMVLWTKIISADSGQLDEAAVVPLAYDIALDETFECIVQSGLVQALADDSLTVRVVASGLSPNTRFWYRFRTGEEVSATGRTRTMPAAKVTPERFGLAVSSCQSRTELQFWDAHRDLADDDSVDLVVWLGDFIYERSDTTTLEEYRGLYETYRGDDRLQASSAAHPWFVTMDDHDVRNDYTAAVDPDRRAAGYRAWWEHMPTRLPRPTGDGLTAYRSLDVGGLARIMLLDCRQYANGSTVLGTAQLDWLDQVAQHKGIHTILGSPVLVSSLQIDDLRLPYAFEAHPADQNRVRASLENAPSPAIVSGDLHVAMEIEFAPGIPEWMAPPLSSLFPERFAPFLPLLPFVSPAVEMAEDSHGYLVVELTPTSATPRFPAST